MPYQPEKQRRRGRGRHRKSSSQPVNKVSSEKNLTQRTTVSQSGSKSSQLPKVPISRSKIVISKKPDVEKPLNEPNHGQVSDSNGHSSSNLKKKEINDKDVPTMVNKNLSSPTKPLSLKSIPSHPSHPSQPTKSPPITTSQQLPSLILSAQSQSSLPSIQASSAKPPPHYKLRPRKN